MAAKPPKPPGTSLNNNNPQQDIATENQSKIFNNSHENSGNNNNNNNNNNNYIASYSSSEPDTVHLSNNIDRSANTTPTSTTTTTTPKPSCNCSNISIMHLFHEMKQEFPTIPDQIVTQCVNENCHDRENCMLMLRNELALNPMPVQAYPSKVLQRQQQQQKLLQLQQQEQQQQQQQQQKPATLLKPTRVAPSPVSVSACVASLNSNNGQTVAANATHKHQNKPSRVNKKNCDSVSVESNSQTQKVVKKDVEIATNTSDMSTTKNLTTPTTTTTTSFSSEDNNSQHADAAQKQQQQQQPQTPQRARPTTLNLNPSQQQQQQQQLRQQLNVQLQQHLQQRQQPTKPVRKAPLPPLPPKPSINNGTSLSPALTAKRATQHSSNTSLSSPISSGESEISVNVGSLSSPTTAGTSPSTQQQQQQQQQQQHHNHNQLKSPIRHRSVINVQPEPPYTRDFLVSPTSSSAGSNSQKSFTSVNLTLRQPNSSAPQSTIDISAGPGLSSAGGTGLTYSSTSYDARRGCQKNFHITVTDEGGVFSASRIKPRSCYNPAGDQKHQLPGSSADIVDVDVSLMRSPTLEQQNQQYPYLYYQPYHQQKLQQQQRVATTVNNYDDMCLPRDNDGFKEILHRQRARREKLTTALRDNKKRLSQVEYEINFLTEPVSPGESERLDSEIRRLRCDCEAMLNEVENSKRSSAGSLVGGSQGGGGGFDAMNSRQQQQQLLLHQTHPPQPFPRQRPPRPPPPTSGIARQPLDFVQHHVVSSTPPSTMHSPNQQLPPLPPTYQQLHQQYQQQLLQQQQILQQQQQQQHQRQQHPQQQQLHQPSTDDEDYSDSNTDGGYEEDEEGLAMWACSMCTFQNHPQLNICECCENVRILPGRIRIVPSATANVAANSLQPSNIAAPLLLTQLSSASHATHANATTPTLTRVEIAAAAGLGAANSLDSDANLTQQHFALHT